ncbi:MAG: DMT family transporter [Spirochaetaceae bacterium]|nr:DMT family transporter [Spirochaetaceae bacterium]
MSFTKLSRFMQIYVQLILAMLFYGVSFVSTKIVLGAYGPVTVLAIRLILSSTFLIVLDRLIPVRSSSPAGAPRERAGRKWPTRADLPSILLLTLFQPLLYFLAENFGLQYVSASIASIIIATIPVFTPFVAGPFLGERIGSWGVVGLALSLGGVAIIVFERQMEAQFTPLGLALEFLAVFAAVGYSVVVRKTPVRYRPLTLVKLQSLIGLPVVLGIALITEGLPTELPSIEVALHLAYLGIFPSSVAFIFFSTGIRAFGASRANVFTNLVPAFTAVFAWLLIGEVFTVQKVLGMAVVVFGVLAAQRGRHVQSPPSNQAIARR